MDQSDINAVFRAYALARANGISFRMIRFPDDAEIDASLLAFNQETMKYLFDLSEGIATLHPIPWETKPPTGEYLDDLCSKML